MNREKSTSFVQTFCLLELLFLDPSISSNVPVLKDITQVWVYDPCWTLLFYFGCDCLIFLLISFQCFNLLSNNYIREKEELVEK